MLQLRKSALISASQPIQPGNQQTLRDHGYELVYHAISLFTPQLSPGTHSSLHNVQCTHAVTQNTAEVVTGLQLIAACRHASLLKIA